MQINSKHSWLKHLDFMAVDLIALFLSFVLSYWMKFGKLNFFARDAWMRLLLVISLLNLVIALFTNPYSGIFRRSYYQEIIKALQLALANLVTTSFFLYLFKMGKSYSREVFFVMYGLYFVLSLTLKYIWKRLVETRTVMRYSTQALPLFVVCDRAGMAKVMANTSAGDLKIYDILGVCVADGTEASELDGAPIVKGDFVDFVLVHNIRDVLVSTSPAFIAPAQYQRLADNGINVHLSIEGALGIQTEEQFISNVGVYKTLSIGEFFFTPGQMIYLMAKRLVDIVCGLLGMVLLVPLSIGIKCAYLLSGDRAKIIYRQERIGQNGRHIRIWKFRSMVPDAGERLEEMLKDERYRREWEENQKFENDPRITPVGRFLRRTSIDELAQLINVLTGEMSLVGPRPLVEGELEAHDGLKLYQRVKPGITGWWGCNGRSNIDYRERLELEYYYVKHCSFYLDLLCIARTVLAVLKRDGAQ